MCGNSLLHYIRYTVTPETEDAADKSDVNLTINNHDPARDLDLLLLMVTMILQRVWILLLLLVLLLLLLLWLLVTLIS